VAEAGEHSLAGQRVAAGKLETTMRSSAGWEHVVFGSPFDAAPVVFAGLQSSSVERGVLARIHDRTPEGFRLGLQDGGVVVEPFVAETIGWIAIREGATTTSDGRRLRVFAELIDQVPDDLGQRSRTRGSEAHDSAIPVTVAGTGSTYDPLPCFVFSGKLRALDTFLQTAGSTGNSVEVAEDVCFFNAE
jgi:hypothetical protein